MFSRSPSLLYNVFSTFLIERCVAGRIHHVERLRIYICYSICILEYILRLVELYICRRRPHLKTHSNLLYFHTQKPAMQLTSSRDGSL